METINIGDKVLSKNNANYAYTIKDKKECSKTGTCRLRHKCDGYMYSVYIRNSLFSYDACSNILIKI
jgi:hypothetical protein